MVSNAAKLIAKCVVIRVTGGLRDPKVVAGKLGIDHDQHGTSHVVFRHLKAGRLSVPAHRPIKAVYVRLFVELVDRVGQQNED